MANGIDLGMQLKYAQDALNELRKKILEREVWESEFAERLAALDNRFTDFMANQAKFAFTVGEMNTLKSSEIGELKLKQQQMNQELGTLSDSFMRHLSNG